MSGLTTDMAKDIIRRCACELSDDEFKALSLIFGREHAVVETEALRLERETMRIQAERIRCLEDELAEARAEIKRLREMSK